MISYEAYMKRNPQVSRNRVERLISDKTCYFLRSDRHDFALLPRNCSTDDLVAVDLNNAICECNVFRTKRACPHVAAALCLVEKSGGQIPYTDPVAHVFACLDRLKNTPKSWGGFIENVFLRDTQPFLPLLPMEQKQKFLLEMALCLEEKGTNLTPDAFFKSYLEMVNWNDRTNPVAELVYKNKSDCIKAVAILLKDYYHCPFSAREKTTILKEISTNDTLSRKCLPFLAGTYASSFSRKQLLDYYGTLKPEKADFSFVRELLKRLVEEEPPLYDVFVNIYNSSPHVEYIELDSSVVNKLFQAGYGNKLQKLVDCLVSRIRGLNDYFNLIQTMRSQWYHDPSDWEIEIDFREDPNADPEKYDLEKLNCRTLEVIRSTRPEFQQEVNQAARKIYRKAMKERKQSQAMEALMILVRGNDSIAVKYAADLRGDKTQGEILVYLALIGTQFDCLPKLVPELKKLEAPHAAG